MTIQLTIDLPEDVFFLLRKSPAEFVGELRLAAIVLTEPFLNANYLSIKDSCYPWPQS